MTDDEPVQPTTDRPWMYGRSGLNPVLLPWSWAERRLVAARNYWIATTRPGGRPHTRPVWGVWLEHAFHFSTGSLAAGNIAANPAITVHLESGAEVVIIESVAEVVKDADLLPRLITAYNEKYLWDLDPSNPDVWYQVRPQLVFGWMVDDSGQDGGAAFHATTTRWRFGH
jgi:hypothetical protein